MAQADRAAGTMFNVFPQGVGERVSRGAQSLAGAAMGMVNRFTNPIGTLASDIGAARQAVSGTRLVGPTSAFQVPPTAPTSVLPSGTPMVGFDAYPTIPQMAPRTEFATASQPAAPSLAAPAPVPAFPTIGMGIMGNQNIRSLPTDQISPMTRIGPTLADRGNVTTDITGMQGKTPIQTPYGTIYAAAGQEAGAERSAALGPMGARYANVRQESNQADKIAQMRERGAAIGQSLVNRQEAYFAQKRAERGALGAAESAARTAGASSMDVMRSRGTANAPSTIGGIQQEFASYQPVVGPTAPTSLYASGAATRFTESLPAGGFSSPRSGSMGLSGTDLYRQQQRDKMARGDTGAFSNARSRQRRATRGTAKSQGIAPATNYSSQLDQEEYFRRRNLA